MLHVTYLFKVRMTPVISVVMDTTDNCDSLPILSKGARLTEVMTGGRPPT